VSTGADDRIFETFDAFVEEVESGSLGPGRGYDVLRVRATTVPFEQLVASSWVHHPDDELVFIARVNAPLSWEQTLWPLLLASCGSIDYQLLRPTGRGSPKQRR
jgi:hypothetical protein